MAQTMAEMLKEIEETRKKRAGEAVTERTILAQAMLAAGVAKASVSFYGSGDSGQIEDVRIEMLPGKEKPSDLHNLLEGWAYKALEGTGVDWYNNDGGQGEFTFDMTTIPPTFTGHIDVNVVESVTEWAEEGAA